MRALSIKSNIVLMIRQANIADRCGDYATATLLDTIIRQAGDGTPNMKERTVKYLKETYPEVALDNIPKSANAQSFWVLTDGTIITLRGLHHDSSVKYMQRDLRIDDDHPHLKSGDGWEIMNKFNGAIRVYCASMSTSVTSYSIPTKEQLNSIQKIVDSVKGGVNIQQMLAPIQDLEKKKDLFAVPDDADIASEYQEYRKLFYSLGEWVNFINGISKAEPNINQNLNNEIANYNFGEPYWKNLENRQLQENFPGEANEPLRTMYEKSADNQRVKKIV